MNVAFEWLALLTGIGIFSGQLSLTFIDRAPKNWAGAVRKYWWYTRLCLLLLLLLSAVFLVQFFLLLDTTSAYGGSIAAYYTTAPAQRQSTLTICLIGLYVAFAKKVGDRVAKALSNDSDPPSNRGPRAALCFLLLAIVSGVLIDCIRAYGLFAHLGAGKISPRAQAIVLMTAILACLVLSLFLWAWNTLSWRLGEFHGFRGPVVREFVITSWFKQTVPRQAILVGPKASGKTELAGFCTDEAGARSTDSTKPHFSKWTGDGWILSVCDMPGENLGDHLIHMHRYRIDKLVFVLRAGALLGPHKPQDQDPKEGKEPFYRPSEFLLDNFPDLCNKTPLGKSTGEYVTAFKLALTGAKSGESQMLRYGVSSILVILNYDQSEQSRVLNQKGECYPGLKEGLQAFATAVRIKVAGDDGSQEVEAKAMVQSVQNGAVHQEVRAF